MRDAEVGDAGAKDEACRPGAREDLGDMGVRDDNVAAILGIEDPAGPAPIQMRIPPQLDPANRGDDPVDVTLMRLQFVQQGRVDVMCGRQGIAFVDGIAVDP